MFKLFPGQPGHSGHLRQLIMHFGSGGDVCFIVAMAVPFLESALLSVIVFSIHCMLFFSENLSLLEEKFFTEESFSHNVYNCCLNLQYY